MKIASNAKSKIDADRRDHCMENAVPTNALPHRYFSRVYLPSILLFAIFLFLNCRPNSVVRGESLDTFTAYLEERIPPLMAGYEIPGVCLAIVRDGRPAWSGAYGYADLAQKRKMTVDAICRVESISKSVTARGVLNLVEEGLLEMDVPINQYLERWTLPGSEYPEQEITIRRLDDAFSQCARDR